MIDDSGMRSPRAKPKPSMARTPPSPQRRPPMVYMANGGSVKKFAAMAGNSKSNTCGPGVSSRKK